jgi:hypothetical protein
MNKWMLALRSAEIIARQFQSSLSESLTLDVAPLPSEMRTLRPARGSPQPPS